MDRFSATWLLTFVVFNLIPIVASGQGRDLASGAGEGFVITPSSGHVDLVDFNFSANSAADGSDARGHIHLRFPDGTNRDYEVFCLSVTGNLATIGGSTLGRVVLITVQDSGARGGVGDTFAAAEDIGQGGFPCQVLQAQFAMSGNVRVRDAP